MGVSGKVTFLPFREVQCQHAGVASLTSPGASATRPKEAPAGRCDPHSTTLLTLEGQVVRCPWAWFLSPGSPSAS